jgi:REP element-mobilizing transposase RayT
MRFHRNGTIYLVTNRCHQERFFMLPRKGVTNIIGAWLARALNEEYGDGIEIFAFIFLSNHFHILLRDNKGQLARFMWYLQLNIGKKINKLNDEREGTFFSREYDAVPVLTDEDFLDKYAYTVTNAVKSKLLAKAAGGRFFNSLKAAREEKPYRFKWFDATAYHNRTRGNKTVERSDFEYEYEISISPPPMWASLTKKKRQMLLGDLVKNYERRYAAERRAEGVTVLGVDRIAKQRWWARPKNSARSPRVKVLCHIKELKEEYLEGLRIVIGAYRELFDGYRKASALGRRAVLEWPSGCYPPSCMRPVGAL